MQSFRMDTDRVPELVEALGAWGELWAPVERSDGVFVLAPIHDPGDARPDAVRTQLPFKKLLLPPEVTLIEATPGDPPCAPEADDAGPKVLFGCHACDIHALRILDLQYLTDYVDPYYLRARRELTVVAYGCWPDEACFCDSLDTSTADDGFDLALTPLGDRVLVTVGTSRGDDIVRSVPHLLSPSTRQDTRDYLDRLRARARAFRLELDVTDLPYVLELKKDDPVWDELGRSCLCCGSCSMVCPTCACFDVHDEASLDRTARRVRTWDSCLFPRYAVVAGGHNFRTDRADRVRNRYYHKQQAFVREFGMPSCVGCGRCIESCPTGINVVEVFARVRGDG
jgi:sulfhydrogenase subunit beta (sulfur reductase)